MRIVTRLALSIAIAGFSLGGFIGTSLASTNNKAHSADPILGLDAGALNDQPSPFIAKDGFYHLSLGKGKNPKIDFPKTLNAETPIVLHTRYGTAKQFLVSSESYRAELQGRYLIYRGAKNSILYRYDADKNSLREFVYLKDTSALPENGEVITWRFEGAQLQTLPDGSVALTKTVDIKSKVRQVSNDSTMAERIEGFLSKRQGEASMAGISAIQTLFTIPKPEYIDGNGKTLTEGIHYRVADNKLILQMDKKELLTFPLWVDPSFVFRADADADIILDGQSANDNFGVSVASAGDFNGDGIDDVIVGAPEDDNNFETGSGSAFIFFGQDLTSGVSLRADADADIILNGQSGGDEFGISVASAGDFNGDGFDDVIIGANRDDNNGQKTSGSAFIFFGQNLASGISLRADADADVILDGQSGNLFVGDEFGISVASAGDFNGDGFDDVIIGANRDDNTDTLQSGRAFIFFGQNPVGQISLRADADANVILDGQSAGDRFGESVASAGDFNGDGFDDVIVGAHLDSNNGESSSGSAFIFFGQNPVSQIILRADADADIILDGQGTQDFFGASVASAGDFNGDGFDDVIIGASNDNNNGQLSSGSAFLFFGQIPVGQLTLRADADADVILDGQSADDLFGISVASAGDFNGDGFDDVIVGAERDDNNGESDSGSAFIFFGSNPVGQLTLRADADADIILDGQSSGDNFGGSVASAGDYNGDGLVDVIVGAHFDDNNGELVSGSAFMFYSPFTTATVHNDFDGNRTSDLLVFNTITGQTGIGEMDNAALLSATLATTLDLPAGETINATGDFNGDQTADILTYNTISGEIETLLLDGSTLLSTNFINAINPLTGFVAQGTGDFDGDGRDEIVLYNPATGQVGFLFLDATGTVQTNFDLVFQLPVANGWTLVDTGDFDADGNDDLLAYNTVSGTVAIFFMDGSTVLLAADVWTLDPASGFVVVDVAEFNSDGTSDLLIHNPATGLTGIATMNGTFLPSVAPLFDMDAEGGETFINVGDYNGDGFSNLLVHNTITGNVTVHLLENGTVQSVQSVTILDFAAGVTLHSGKP